MKDFWQFPTVSMGLGPINSIYQARFMRYLENRGLIAPSPRKVWAFLGDGEMDEPESTGAIGIATREKLDNLIFVVNCNLQRLDGPVRGNGNIVSELEAAVPRRRLERDQVPVEQRLGSAARQRHIGPAGAAHERVRRRRISGVQGQGRRLRPQGILRHAIRRRPQLVEDMTDEQIGNLRRGGHDPLKVYNAYKAATEHKGGPTVVLAKTVKGYGMGDSGEGRNYTHQQKKLNEKAYRVFPHAF